MMKKVFARIWWLGRGMATAMGVAVMLAVVLGVATTALAAVPGDPFKLGRTNTIDQLSTVIGSTSGALLRINNNGSGPALDLRVEEGKAPMNVSSDTRVNGLNADKLDDHGANDFLSEERIYVESNSVAGSGGGEDETVFAHCDSGDKVLGGGGGAPFSPDLLRVSEPNGQGWLVVGQDNGNAGVVQAQAICADFPPLR